MGRPNEMRMRKIEPLTGEITSIIPAPDRIIVKGNRLSINELVKQLEFYNCPKEIIEKLEEWMLDLYFDREKLRKWKENCEECR